MTGQGRVAIVCQDQPPEGVCVHEFTCWIRVLPGTPDAVHGERALALWSLPSPRVRPRRGHSGTLLYAPIDSDRR